MIHDYHAHLGYLLDHRGAKEVAYVTSALAAGRVPHLTYAACLRLPDVLAAVDERDRRARLLRPDGETLDEMRARHRAEDAEEER